jgi:cytochrome c oxidase assembly protein subunit 15
VLSAQIVLGGWTSTNYAALACTDLPTCQGSWWPVTDFANAFSIFRELGMDSTGKPLDAAALTAIHLTHRIGAIVAAVVLLWLAMRAHRRPLTKQPARWLIVALIGQILLGISNVIYSLPLAVAVAHNGLAAVLMMIVVVINYRVFRAHSSAGH